MNGTTLPLLVLSLATEVADRAQQDLTKCRKIKDRNGPWRSLLSAINWRHLGPSSGGEKTAYRHREGRLDDDVKTGGLSRRCPQDGTGKLQDFTSAVVSRGSFRGNTSIGVFQERARIQHGT